ncbi:MAG: peroxide stress protein YaaA [Anaerolineae bacterium]|nr:peroxide stress protein YaaA [Anaerolineae bacterium]
MEPTKRLLILACSQRKRPDPGLLPAMERYDGGSYRILHKIKREGHWPKNLDVLILSAKYGLIEASTPIADYEQRITRERASQLKPQVIQTLQNYSQQNTYSEVYVDLGQDYLSAIEGFEKFFSGSSITRVKGRIGERLKSLKSWLKVKYEECQ